MSFDNLKNPRGGARPNSGRKKGEASIAAERMRERMAIEIEKRTPELLTALFDKSLGHYQEKEILGGLVRVYKTAPDIQAMKEVQVKLKKQWT
jgi:hypothetical protein